MRNAILIVILGAVLIVLAFEPQFACRSANTGVAPSGLQTVSMKIGNRSFVLEVADTNASRERGLMFRDSMAADAGMIFVFPEQEELSFWMKNTKLPLDILFLDANGRIVSIHQMKPFDEKTTPSDGPAKYAIELNQGMAAKIGVKAGDRLELPKEVAGKRG